MIEFRRLTLAELDEFLEFMDGPAFDSQPQWRGCYCQFYLNTQAENDEPQARGAVNRQKACDRINTGVMQGYLAYSVESGAQKVIGWMAANKFNNFVALPPQNADVAAIICFVVDREWQGKKVATNLLEFALKDLPKHGFTQVQSAPLRDSEFRDWGYRGPRSMFEKAGFMPIGDIDDKHILMGRKL